MTSRRDFAVLDVETTGFSAGGHDRVVEIAVIRLDPSGQPVEELATLVNPERDVGPTHIHGISARDVRDAPTMGEIAGDVLDVMAGAAIVGHNVSFDHRFLVAEYDRLGVQLPDCVRICTMSLARRLSPDAPSRKLVDLCAHWGIPLVDAHTALDDARATAALFSACVRKACGRRGDPLDIVPHKGAWVPRSAWPRIPASGKRLTRAAASHRRKQARSYIGSLVSRLPQIGNSDPDSESYLAMLDRVLEDRVVELRERDALHGLALELGMTPATATSLHRQYLAGVISAALADGIITEPEQEDLDDVTRLLDLSPADYNDALSEVQGGMSDNSVTEDARPGSVTALRGKSVCFTGALRCCVKGERATRAMAKQIAADAGMIVKPSVTKKLDYLVAADPESVSGKARKAHEYGVRVIAESVFWVMAGIDPF